MVILKNGNATGLKTGWINMGEGEILNKMKNKFGNWGESPNP